MDPRSTHDAHSDREGPRGPRGLRDPGEWHRDYPGRRIAGVCASVAENLEVSVSVVRAFFVLTSFFHLTGVILYAALWVLLPAEPGQPSAFDRGVRSARRLLEAREDTPRGDAGSAS